MSTIPSWAKIGAKVVYVFRRHAGITYDTRAPSHHQIYTVREVRFVPSDGDPVILLAEIENTHEEESGIEYGYYITSFRPAVAPKTEAEDMAEHFDKLLITDPIVRLDELLALLDT